MVFSIRHRGLESPEIAWRRNLREDSLKLGAELRRSGPRDAAHFERVALYGKMRAELPKSFRNGTLLTQVGPISEITNFTSSVTYARIDDAIYQAASGDEIILPAGSGATHSATFTRYSNYSQLNSWVNGYSGNSSSAMVFGNPSINSNPSLYNATYLSVVGVASSNNLSSVTWASTGGGQLTAIISGSAVTTYRLGMYVRISGATNTGTGGVTPGQIGSINNTFTILSVSGGTLVLNAPASAGVYGTIGGSPVLNNDRAQISMPVGYLTTTLNPGDTTIVLDDAADFNPAGASIYAWGNGDGAWQSVQMAYTGVSGNTLTGVTASSGLTSPVPIGTPIIQIVPSGKAMFTPAAVNAAGITMSNLELWGAAAYPSGGAIFEWVNTSIGGAIGSLTLNNLFFHDCMFGIRPGNSSVGSGVFLEIFDSEFWRCGLHANGFNHNAYMEADILTIQNTLSWQDTTLATGVSGAHLFKSRSRVNYMLYNRTLSDHGSTANPGNTWSSNYDFPNGGEIYLIGCELVSSLHDSTSLIRHGEEMNYPNAGIGGNSNRGAANPLSALYVVNCNGLGPSNGTGTFQTNDGPVTVGWPGLKCPEIPFVSSVGGGSLPARSYWTANTLIDVDGNESLPSCMSGFDAFVPVTAKTAIAANSLAVTASPIARTGAVAWNNWAAHADATIYWNNGGVVPPATGPVLFYWDSGHTLPVGVVNAGGSQPAAFVMVAIVLVFADGTESVNFAVSGNDLRFPSSTTQVNAAMISIPINNLLTVKSPPSATGVTGWYPLVTVTAWNSAGAYFVGGPAFLSRQVWSPIAIGTDWVQSGPFIKAETARYNFYKQNASPISMGTDFTEASSGLVNLNPANMLKWYRRANDDALGFSRWYAVADFAATNYVVNAYNDQQDGNYWGHPFTASVQVWSGATTPFPFDADYPSATLTTAATSATATTAATNTALLASFRNPSTAGAGWTQVASLGDLMAEYKIVSSPQAGSSVTQTGGGSTSIIVDAITQSTTLAVRGTPQSSTNATTNVVSFTVPTIAIGDVLIFDASLGNGPILLDVDPLAWGPPAMNQALAHSPVGLVINNAFAYYAPATTGGYIQTFPGVTLFGGVGYPTVSSFNLQVNAYNGSSFNAPLVAAVWTNAATFDFTLVGGSPLIGAGTNPGTGGGFSLVPTSQTLMNGTPTPGFPISALAARTDNGLTLGPIQATTSGGLRLRWMRFGWDWKIVVTLGAAALIENNPRLSRRNMLTLSDRTAPPRGKRRRPSDS